MKKRLLTICLLVFSLATSNAFGNKKVFNLDGMFTVEFRKQITVALQSAETKVFKTPIRGLRLYNDNAKLYGQLKVGNGEIIANGLLSVRGSLTKADNMLLEQTQINAQHATFIVKSKNPSRPVLEVNDVAVIYDFVEKNAFVESQNKLEQIILPHNHTALGFNNFFWGFDTQDLSLKSAKDTDALEVRSLNILHKGLSFNAKMVDYNFKSKELHIEGVDFIGVSNAQIVPQDGKLKMKEGAKLDTLKNAKVLFADGNEDHSFSTGDILIQSKEKFDGIGNYEFETYNGEKLMLQFTNFRQSSRQVAHGSGSKQITENIGESFIPAEKNIEIMPGILYTGKVFLSDYKKEFDLDGLIALNVEGEEKHWIKYNTVNDAKISILHKMEAANSGKHLHTGIFLDGSERELYSSFVAPSDKDGIPVFVAEGELDYNSESKSYELSKVKKHNFGVNKEQKFHYHHGLQEIDFEGVVNLGEATRYFSQRSAAVGTINKKTKELEMNTLLVLDVKAPKKIFEHMIFTLDEYKLNHGAKPTNKKLFASQLYHVASNEELNFIADQKPVDIKLNDLFDNSIAITNLELHWSEKQHAFYSKGKLGLSNLFNMNVDADLNGFIYMPKRQSNHELHFYFEVGDDWYYMKRDGDLLSFRSSREDFNKMLKGKSGRYTLISETEANIVIDRHNRADY